MESNRVGFSEALFAPQVPVIHLHEQEEVAYLSDAIVELDWTQSEIPQCATVTPSCNFHELYVAVVISCLQKQKEEDGKRRDQNQHTFDPKIPEVLWENQIVYGIPKNHGSRSSNPIISFNNIYEDRSNIYHLYYHNHRQHLYHRDIRYQQKDNIFPCNGYYIPDQYIKYCNYGKHLVQNFEHKLKKIHLTTRTDPARTLQTNVG